MITLSTFTDLVRHPKDVIAQTESGIARTTRRDAEDLIIMRAGEAERQHRGMALASSLMRAALRYAGDMPIRRWRNFR